MAITELTRLCASCRTVLPDPPAAPVCPRCAAVHVPLAAAWDPRVPYFLAACFTSRHAFHSFDSHQVAFEKLLRATFNYAGGGKYGHPFGALGITTETSAVELYPHAVKLAAHWRSLGAPLTHDLLITTGHNAGLIPSTHPLLRAG